MSNINKQVVREAAEKATALNLATAQVKRGNDGYLECPCCEGAGYVEEESDFCNIDGVALGVQFYGIGEHHGLAESYLRAANPTTVLALLDELEAAEKRVAELEVREVILPSVQDVHPLGPQSAKIFCEFHRNIINRCADEIRKVGVNVSIKGE